MRCEANVKRTGERCKRYCANGLRRCSRHRPYRGPSRAEATREMLDAFSFVMDEIMGSPPGALIALCDDECRH